MASSFVSAEHRMKRLAAATGAVLPKELKVLRLAGWREAGYDLA